ncbi:MAG: N-acetylmuramoyl-L-alanine amidase [Pseudomonadota bacterium]
MPSPNFDGRTAPPDIIVLHYTDMKSAASAVRWLTTAQSKVSAHYLIGADGDLFQMVAEEDRAWHAGLSFWDGSEDVNARSIGIELDCPGHRPDAPTFPAVQIDALLDLLATLRARWPVPRRNVVGHSDVAPSRKIDPGERFPWAKLVAEGHALEAIPVEPTHETELTKTLAACGYGPAKDVATRAHLIKAFHRRHRPDAVTAPADAHTAALAEGLAQAVAKERESELAANANFAFMRPRST